MMNGKIEDLELVQTGRGKVNDSYEINIERGGERKQEKQKIYATPRGDSVNPWRV